MKKTLEGKGWAMYWECGAPCFKQYFNHEHYPGYEIRYKTKSKTFSIIYQNQIVAGPFWEYQLEEKLNEFVK